MAEEEIMIDEESIALEDSDDSVVTDIDVTNIIPFVMDRYQRAEDYRNNDEERWLRSYRNYRGLYGSDVQFTEAEKSRVFIKVTKTKTLAAYGQMLRACKPYCKASGLCVFCASWYSAHVPRGRARPRREARGACFCLFACGGAQHLGLT